MVIDLFLGLFIVPVVVLAWMARSRGRQWAGTWLLVLAPLYMPLGEDGALAVWYALATPGMDPHAVRGVINPHALGHMLGAGVAAIVLGVVASWVAHRHLRTGAPWAWKLLLSIGVPVVAVGLVELVAFYGHGLPTGSESGGFGWPFWAAGVFAWVLGLVLSRPKNDNLDS